MNVPDTSNPSTIWEIAAGRTGPERGAAIALLLNLKRDGSWKTEVSVFAPGAQSGDSPIAQFSTPDRVAQRIQFEDVDGDGYDEFIVRSTSRIQPEIERCADTAFPELVDTGGACAGAATHEIFVFEDLDSRTSLERATVRITADSPTSADVQQYGLAPLGDLDGNGRMDVAVFGLVRNRVFLVEPCGP